VFLLSIFLCPFHKLTTSFGGLHFQKGEKILHTWFNPFFFTSGVTSFPRGEVEGAYKDKKFKTFPADFVLQIETSYQSR